MIRKIRVFACCVGVLCGLCSSLAVSAASTEKLSVRGSNNYPPFEFVNQSGEPDGFNVDIIRALMDECGFEYDLRLEDWATVVDEIQQQKIDVVIGMIYSPERAENVRFTLPICVIQRNIITRKGANIHSMQELEGKDIIVERGGWFHRYLLANNFSGKIIESDDIYESLKLLEQGKHDAVLASELATIYAMNRLGINDLKIVKTDIAPQDYAIAVNQDQDEILYQLNQGLQHLKFSGVYDQIYNKWFGIYESRQNTKALLIALGIFLFISFWLILFVWLLRKQVAKATRMLHSAKQEVELAIDAGRISAWTYAIESRTFTMLHGEPIIKSNDSVDAMYCRVHPEEAVLLRCEIEDLSLNRKQSASFSFRIREGEQSSSYRYIETKMVRVEATQELPCRIVGTFKDVTDEVLMSLALAEFRKKCEFIIRTNDIVLIQFDIAQKLFLRINEDNSQKETQSYDMEEYLRMVYPDDLPIANHFVEQLERGVEGKIEAEYRMISPSGRYYWYSITAIAYTYDAKGTITSYMGLRRNNTKWKEINNDLILLREKAETSNRLKSAFIANMSHEIRTPLNAIVGFSELLIETDDKEDREKFIEIVRTNNDLMLRLINDILDLSKIEAGHIDFCCARFDFASYFRELAMSLKIKERPGVELKWTDRYEDLVICSDCNRISQVITNFVTNAFKFTKKGSVTLDCLYENDGIRLSVTDTGIGIAPENRMRIFERFEKVNEFAQGTGLGLPICKVIVEALQGQIGVESEVGVGSTFWFWLPSNNGMEEGMMGFESPVQGVTLADILPRKELASSADGAESPDAKSTILVAEDNDNNFIIIDNVLRDSYHVVRAVNGLEAVEKTKMYNPSIILMDMKMPVMDGLSATKEIRKFNSVVPIVALTAYVFDTNKQEAIGAGCDEFMTKPVNRSVLMQVLNSMK